MRKSAPLVAAAAAAVVLAGCSASETPNEGGEAERELTPVSVGVIPIVDVAPAYLGLSQGFFEDEGLDVSLELAQGGAAIATAVVSGDYDFGFSNLTSLLLATDNNIPLQAVSPGVFTTGEEPDFGAVVVPEDSDIESAADLAGATVAVNALNNVGDSTIRNVVEEAGGDESTIEFVEMGFPDMPAAVSAEQVDAAWIVEPHLTRALQDGARAVSWNFAETDPNFMISVYFSNQQFVAENPEIVEAFDAALDASFEYAEENPEELRAVLNDYVDIEPAVAEAMVMPRFETEFNTESVDQLADLAVRYGMVDEGFDYSRLLP